MVTVWSGVSRVGERIPSRYTCDGRDMSPPISWKDIHSDTRSITLIMDDPDTPGGTFVHQESVNA